MSWTGCGPIFPDSLGGIRSPGAFSPSVSAGYRRFLLIIVLCLILLPSFGQAASQGVSREAWRQLVGEPLVPTRQVSADRAAMPAWMARWEEAREAVRHGNLPTAARLYDNLLAKKPELAEAAWELARLRFRLGDGPGGITLLEALAEHEPGNLVYRALLGRAILLNGQADRAVALLNQVLGKEPENSVVLAALVGCYFSLQQPDRALAPLETLHRLDPDDGEVRLRLARLYVKLGLDEQARQHLVELGKDEHAGLDLLVMTAQVHDRLGLENLADAYWQRVLDLQADQPEASRRLAREQGGRLPEALAHLRPLPEEVTEPSVLKQVADLYSKEGNLAKALPYLEKYMTLRPADQDMVLSLVRLHANLGNRAEMVMVLERFFAIQAEPQALELRQAARFYDATGRFREAVPLYQRLLTMAPDDPELHVTLAVDLFKIGKHDPSLAMRKHPAQPEPGREELYHSMTALLARLDRDDDVLEVLETMNDLKPADSEVIRKLARLYLQQGKLIRSLNFFEQLALAGPLDAAALEDRATLFERSGQRAHALADFEELLRLAPERQDIRRRALRQAGVEGLLADVRRHLGALETGQGGELDAESVLAGAAALRQCGVYREALQRCQRFLADQAADDGQTERRIHLEMAAIYRAAGLPFEAEQVLRTALLLNQGAGEILEQLVFLALEQPETAATARIWFGRWQEINPESEPAMDRHRARLLAAIGERGAAMALSRDLFEKAAGAPELGAQPEMGLLWQADGLELAGELLADDKPEAAEKICLRLLQEGRVEQTTGFEPLVLLFKSYLRQKKVGQASDVFARIQYAARQDADRLLTAVRLFRTQEMSAETLTLARAARQARPDSLEAAFLLAEALEATGDKAAAAALLLEVRGNYPDNDRAGVMLADLLFRQGDYEQALALCETLLVGEAPRPDLVLLKARTLWALQRWTESMAVYEAFLKPAAEQGFLRQLAERGLDVPLTAREQSWWEQVTFAGSEPPSPLALALDPLQMLGQGNIAAPVVRAAVPYFALRSWQNRFASEGAARQAVQRREYFQAMYLFKSILRESPREAPLLFDLAGIYSRLDLLQDEAVLYRRLTDLDASYPGVKEASQRNQLKRQPRVTFGGGLRRDEGYAGYQAMETESLQTSVWLSPRPGHDFDVSLARPVYTSTDLPIRLVSRRFYLAYRNHFMNGLSLDLGGGLEGLAEGYATTGLVRGKVSGEVGDKLDAHLSFSRDLVTDTTASLTRNVVAHAASAGLSLDLLPRLKVGGDYGVRNFSDNNFTMRYDLWTSYLLFEEPYALSFTYNYGFYDSREGANPGTPLTDGFGVDDHPYWAPRSYWKNRFELFFKHQFSKDVMDRGIPRYYTLRYSLDYDSFGYGGQNLEGGLYLEITPRFILEASTMLNSSQLARSREVALSAICRW